MRITYYHFSSVDSTNSWAKRHKSDLAKDSLAIITCNEQTQGKGRHLRSWYAPKGKNITLSFAFFEKDITLFSPFFFSQLAALCLVHILEKYALQATIKWPNDILIDGKKIAGILTETEKEADDTTTFIILGIGLNVNTTKEDLINIPKIATSMLVETGTVTSLKTVVDEVVNEFLLLWQTAKKEGVQPLEDEWLQKVSWMVGKQIVIVDQKKEMQGTIVRIEKDASLVLLLDDGCTSIARSGDVFL